MDKVNEIEQLTIAELKSELRKYCAKTSGRKAELVERLKFYKINSKKVDVEPEYHMKMPENELFKDLHGGMVLTANVKQERLISYLQTHDKKYDEKYRLLYEQRYIQYIRTCHFNEQTYFKSNVRAEMKKDTCYNVNMMVDSNGVILEAECECGASQGPSSHCKHVSAVYFGLCEFAKTKILVTEVTCTQKLQTFHQAKNYNNSPIKANQLCEAQGQECYFYYDPRPVPLRNTVAFRNNWRNICINGQLSAMPSLELIPPANPYALAHDHDYMNLSPEDWFLQQKMVTHISMEQAGQLEMETRGQSHNQKWRDSRLFHITASRFGEICLATERKNLGQLAIDIASHKNVSTDATLHGIKYEKVAIEKFEKKTGIKTYPCGLFIFDKFPALAASPDAIIDHESLVEVKCPYKAKDREINPVAVPFLKCEDGKLSLIEKSHYYFQVQGQLMCSNRKKCYFVVFTMKDMCVIEIQKDEQFCKNMTEKLMHFYKNHFREAILEKFFYRRYRDYQFEYN